MRARAKEKRTILMETVGFSDTYSALKNTSTFRKERKCI